MSTGVERPCTVLIDYDAPNPPTSSELTTILLNGRHDEKVDALKTLILIIMHDENYPKLMMTVIQSVVILDDHELKKLLLIYWELVDKINADGTLKDEIILVCNSLRNDLLHSNEFLRGRTLRLVSKLKFRGILDSLQQPIIDNLVHDNSYVKRNALMCIFSIYNAFGNDYFEEIEDQVEKLLVYEADLSTKRNAFLLLFTLNQTRAFDYLNNLLNSDQANEIGDIMQLAILEFLRKKCKSDPAEKAKFLKVIFNFTNSKSMAVLFECANTLIQLTSSTVAVKLAVTSYVQLLNSQSDNNVKMIILDKLSDLRVKHTKVLEEQVLDLLKVLGSPSRHIRDKALNLVFELSCPSNIESIVNVFEKELVRIQQSAETEDMDYRQLLIKIIHRCAVKFPDIAENVVQLLMNHCFNDSESSNQLEVVLFVREIIDRYENLKESILEKMCDYLNHVKKEEVFRVMLWILGEYAETEKQIANVFETLEVPFGYLKSLIQAFEEDASTDYSNQDTNSKEDKPKKKKKLATRTVVLADGSYGTEVINQHEEAESHDAKYEGVFKHIFTESYYLCSVVAMAMTKLVYKLRNNQQIFNKFAVEGMLRLCIFLKLQKLNLNLDNDTKNRVEYCIRLMVDPSALGESKFLESGREALANMIAHRKEVEKEELETEALYDPTKRKAKAASDVEVVKHPDSLLNIRQLKGRSGLGAIDLGDDDTLGELDGFSSALGKKENFSARLDKVQQLAGLSEPLYIEGFVEVRDYDIDIDLLIINQTKSTIANLNLEFYTVGDLKLVEKPQSITLGPGKSTTAKALVKVTSTAGGTIFGTSYFDNYSKKGPNHIIMNPIYVRLVEYMYPASCTETAFRKMWAEYDWENKVAVNTNISDLKEYLDHLVAQTKMKSLSSLSTIEDNCGFLSVNLYAKSKFGEDVLMNISVDKQTEKGKIAGFVRIRSKTQRIALVLGERIQKIQNVQKK